MTSHRIQIEPLGGHDHLVSVTGGEADVEFTVRAMPSSLEALGFEAAREHDVVAATVDFLIRRQGAEDLPGFVDLDDACAAYEDLPVELARQLR
ncbi:MAG: hypothetical protein ABI746_10050 [Dermatophilaceae bacterium]